MTASTSIHQRLLPVLQSVLGNTWWLELPPRPAWPAAVFSVETAPEPGWCAGGGYDAHDATVIVLSRSAIELDALLPTGGGGAMRAALEGMEHYQWEVGCEDADYEDDPQVYGRALIVRLRTPRYITAKDQP
ncbi:hypothetical protein [Delftia sp. PS-11]|uniref:hypothetical protein n=1 Tax=Delftia sp. PS-11 TaxID=2767222 RepID=UPI00245707DF|nr:hypothetical protein [Delftia sp. PS-11]KAJ8745436.1 hypothetical protein H9T68_06450 [Delftia sp. PS-11]